MKTLSLVIFLISFCQNSFCQGKTLSIESPLSDKDIAIKENKRIIVITKNGEKFKGRFMVLDQNSIAVGGVVLGLNEIDLIRRHSLFVTILVKANFFHTGTLAFLVFLIPGSFSFMMVGAALLAVGAYAGIKLPYNSKVYTAENNWNFKLKGWPEDKATISVMPIVKFSFKTNPLRVSCKKRAVAFEVRMGI